MFETENEKLAQQFVQLIAAAMRTPLYKNAIELTRGEVGALLCLYQHRDGISSGKMGELMNISSGGVANLLKTLEGKGMLTRSFSEQDRRCVLVKITQKGVEYAEERYGAMEQRMVKLVEAMGREKVVAIQKELGEMLSIAASLGE